MIPRILLTLAVALLLVSCTRGGAAEDAARQLPQGAGLAAEFPGDIGLDQHPDVVFVENFEAPDIDQVMRGWETVSEAENMSLSPDVPTGSGGKHSLLMSHVGGGGESGYLYRRLTPGYEELFVRFYVKFDRDCAPVHHFFHIGGYNPSTLYPQGGAGVRPLGDKRFTVGIEPHGKAWVWDYYAYWMEMGGSPPRGQTWGNSFIRDSGLKVERDQWICMETYIKLNDVGDSNGELALWIDGKKVSHLGKGFPKGKWIYDKFTPGDDGDGVRWSDEKRGPEYFSVPTGGNRFDGFRWRSSEDLKINFLWVLFYMTDIPKGHVSKVQFDDIVVAKQYIGPHAAPDSGAEQR